MWRCDARVAENQAREDHYLGGSYQTMVSVQTTSPRDIEGQWGGDVLASGIFSSSFIGCPQPVCDIKEARSGRGCGQSFSMSLLMCVDNGASLLEIDSFHSRFT
ncbi:hypothetical protein J3459_015092 [Metarhizium acridum]|nr:hypothetical protein J3459_015092 [Metarhizium acridum]